MRKQLFKIFSRVVVERPGPIDNMLGSRVAMKDSRGVCTRGSYVREKSCSFVGAMMPYDYFRYSKSGFGRLDGRWRCPAGERNMHEEALVLDPSSSSAALGVANQSHVGFQIGVSSKCGPVSVEGTIKKVQYRASETGYTVLKVGVSPEYEGDIPDIALEGSNSHYKFGKKKNKKEVAITVVGILPVLHVGQGIFVKGSWTTHPTYGMQLKASHVEARTPTGQHDLVSFLSGGAIHGVGPSTALKLVETWGSSILDVLDSSDAVASLQRCDGIGRNKAVAIKTAWDSGRDARLGANFLCERGIPAGPAQRVAEAFGAETQSKVLADPYATLNRFGIPLDSIEAFAVKTNAPKDLISRISLVVTRSLLVSSNRDGHAYLTWTGLESLVFKRLESLSNKFNGDLGSITHEQLKLVAWHMCLRGTLICESENEYHSHSGSRSQNAPSIPLDDVRDILNCISKKQFDSLVDTYGDNLVNVLSYEDDEAAALLKNCHGIGPKTIEKIMLAWKERKADVTGKSPVAGIVRISDLQAANIEPPCEWSNVVRCYLPQFHKAETTVVGCVKEKALLNKEIPSSRMNKIKQWIDMNQETTNVVLSRGQRAAIEMASDAPILVITGGPGCGKTTVLQYIVKLWCAQGKMVHICAPTGRAAQRIGAIQNVEPSTIHRLLKYRPKSASDPDTLSLESMDEDEIDMGEMDCFEHGSSNKLDSDAVLVDEASMLSLPLAAALMQSLKPSTQLILVGDVDQLPPVGPGGILDAMISSGVVPVVDLREIFRQEMTSTIVTSALAVRAGRYPPIVTLDAHDGSNFNVAVNEVGSTIIKTGSSLTETIENLVHTFLNHRKAEIRDIQVISPMRKGPVGVGVLNPRIQAIVNPPELGKLEVSRGDLILRMGDRVLQLHNDYDKDVYNGDQGTIVDVDPVLKKVWVHFSRGFGGQSQVLEYSGMELSHLDLAYAVTIHKAQGGEAKHVVMALSPQHGRLLTRPLLYTGITRARETLVMAVESSSIDPISVAINTIGMETRLSALVERLVSSATESSLPFHDTISFYDDKEDVWTIENNTGDQLGITTLLTKLKVDEKTSAILLQKVAHLASIDLVEPSMLREHVHQVSSICTNGEASMDQVLQTVPLLVGASPDYLDKSLRFSEKIIPSTTSVEPALESLVEQLAALRALFQGNK